MSLFLVALAGLLFSAVMLRSGVFGRGIAIPGLLAAAADLTYCLTFALLAFLQMYLMALAGLLWMLWHLLIASRLLRWSGRQSITQVINHWVT